MDEKNIRIVKRGDKEYKYYVETFYHNGKQYTVTGKSPKDAIIKAEKKKTALENGETGISGKMTVKRWADEWLATYKADLGPGARKDTKSRIDNLIVPAIGALRLTEVTEIHLQKIMNSRQGMSKSEIDKTYNLICGLFKQARISRLVQFDVSEGVRKPKAEYKSRRSITDTERKYILQLAETHVAGLWVKTMLYCGLRPGETIALCWKDIDFKNKTISVTKANDKVTNELKAPKSSAGIREVPIPTTLLKDFKAAAPNPMDPFAPVFTQQTTSNRHTSTSIKNYWRSFKKDLDILMGAKYEKRKALDGKMRNTLILSVVAPDLVPYCLRHTYGTDLEVAGIPINVAKYLMGHEDIKVTSSIYTHTTDKVLKEAATKLNAMYNENNNEKRKLKLRKLAL